MIKVTVRDTATAKELIEAFKGKEYDVEIIIKENTTTENSDVKNPDCFQLGDHKISRTEDNKTRIIKENTTATNSDVSFNEYGPKYHKASWMLSKIKKVLEQDF